MLDNEFTFSGWAILEMLGHRKIAGYITPVTLGSEKLLQVNVYQANEVSPSMTQFYNPSSLYCMTPTTEQICRHFTGNPQPVTVWDIKRPALVGKREEDCEEIPY